MEKIPKQEKGAKSDNAHSIHFNKVSEAKENFTAACKKLLDVNQWHHICNNLLKAQFFLCDERGNPVNRMPVLKDYFKIDIPGPGTINGEGFDWVQIEEIINESPDDSNSQVLSIKVRPASCPLNEDSSTAHFLDSSATSNFLVKREGTVVTAEIHGRNEIPNNHTNKALDDLRNTVVTSVAVSAFSDIQWKELCRAILKSN